MEVVPPVRSNLHSELGVAFQVLPRGLLEIFPPFFIVYTLLKTSATPLFLLISPSPISLSLPLNLSLTPTPPHSSPFLLPQGPSCVLVIPNSVPPLFLCPSQSSGPYLLSQLLPIPASPFLEPLSTGPTHAKPPSPGTPYSSRITVPLSLPLTPLRKLEYAKFGA